MSTYLLDTNVCIEFLRQRNTSVAAKLATHAAAEIRLCSVVLSELYYGALRSADPVANWADVQKFAVAFQSLPFDDAAAAWHARLRAEMARLGTPLGPHDSLIAAIAMAHGLVVVTHNINEFSRVAGLTLEDWQT